MGTNERTGRWRADLAVVAAALLGGFGAAHLIDDFLYGVPAEFNLAAPTAQVLAFVFFVAFTGLAARVGQGRRVGYLGLAIIGILLAVADSTKHLVEMAEPGPYRSGWVSEALVVGLIASGLLAGLAGLLAWSGTRPRRPTGD